MSPFSKLSLLTFVLVFLYIAHPILSKRIKADDKHAPLRGELVPSSYVHPTHLAYDCYYGVSLMNNCSCSELQSKMPGCHGPKCLLLEKTTTQYTVKSNFTCIVSNNTQNLDCSHNDAKNLYIFSSCRNGNMTQALNLINYEFRFESINAKEQRSIVRCPLVRKPNTYLQGYSIDLKVLIHKVRDSFISHGYATEIIGCQTGALESNTPLSDKSPFYQMLSIAVAPICNKKMSTKEQIYGCLLGGIVGDAIGTTVEFMTREYTNKYPVTDMVGGGKFELLPGQFTDDSSMMLCLAESLLLQNGFDATDQQQRYWNWYENGHLSSNGMCFDIGKQTLKNLLQNQQFLKKNEKDKICKLDLESTGSGNGSLMRLAPIPLYYINDDITAIQMSGQSSLLTHRSQVAYDCCRLYGMYILGALQRVSKEEMLQPDWFLNDQVKYLLTQEQPLCSTVLDIKRNETFKTKQPPPLDEENLSQNLIEKYITGNAYVISSMEAALWAFYHTNTYEEGVFKAANLADDADTVTCIYGQLAGAYYGIEAIPKRFIEKLALKPYLEVVCKELYSHSLNKNATCSDEFIQLSTMLQTTENEYHQQIQRKVLPGPFMFRSLEQFDNALENWKHQMDQLFPNPSEAMNHILQVDFLQSRAQQMHRLKVQLRCQK